VSFTMLLHSSKDTQKNAPSPEKPYRHVALALLAKGRRELIPLFRWQLPGAQNGAESVFELKNGRAYLLEPDGTAVEGILFVGEVATE
jgi:hypothetical protein